MSRVTAFDDVYAASRDRLLLQLYAYCGDARAADDALKEAFITASHHWHRVASRENVDGWLRQRAVRRLDGRTRPDPTRLARRPSAQNARLLAALGALDPTSRRLLIVRRLDNLDLSVVAREVGLTDGAAEQAMARASSALHSHGVDSTPAGLLAGLTRLGTISRDSTPRLPGHSSGPVSAAAMRQPDSSRWWLSRPPQAPGHSRSRGHTPRHPSAVTPRRPLRPPSPHRRSGHRVSTRATCSQPVRSLTSMSWSARAGRYCHRARNRATRACTATACKPRSTRRRTACGSATSRPALPRDGVTSARYSSSHHPTWRRSAPTGRSSPGSDSVPGISWSTTPGSACSGNAPTSSGCSGLAAAARWSRVSSSPSPGRL